MIVEASNGCKNRIDSTIATLPTPNASFNTPKGCPGTPTNFSSSSTPSASITSTQWNFGDGSAIVSGLNPSHTYLTSGTYSVTLTVSSGTGCADTTTHTIVIPNLPVPSFNATSICFGQPTVFTDLTPSGFGSAAITNWSWNFGDGSLLSSNSNPSHQFQSVNTFTVTLTVTTANGCLGSTTKNIIVKPLPVPLFTIAGV